MILVSGFFATAPFRRDKPAINEIIREAEAGGVVYRLTKAGKLQIVLFQDVRDRWTIPKGHIEEGETAQESAIREIGEEVGLFGIEPVCWLGKVNFRYRRGNSLVIINMQTYLFKAGKDENLKKKNGCTMSDGLTSTKLSTRLPTKTS